MSNRGGGVNYADVGEGAEGFRRVTATPGDPGHRKGREMSPKMEFHALDRILRWVSRLSPAGKRWLRDRLNAVEFRDVG